MTSPQDTARAARRPRVVAFDVIETLFSLRPVDDALDPLGVRADLYFARLLRDGFALAASGGYRPFPDLARSTLVGLSPGVTDEGIDAVLGAFARLPAQPDARPAFEVLVEAGLTVVTLSNGTAELTRSLLDRAGLARYVERVVSVDEVHAWKPSAHPYRHVVEVLGRSPGEVAMVAVHAWDVHGARQAGLVTGWASRFEGRYPEVFDPPDVTGPDLVAVAEGLIALPA